MGGGVSRDINHEKTHGLWFFFTLPFLLLIYFLYLDFLDLDCLDLDFVDLDCLDMDFLYLQEEEPETEVLKQEAEHADPA